MLLRTAGVGIYLAVCIGLCPAAAQSGGQNGNGSPIAAETFELLEDLRVLSIINVLEPTRDQVTRLTAVSVSAQEGLASIETGIQARLDLQGDRLDAARARVLRGGSTPANTDAQLSAALQTAEASRAQKTEVLILTLTARVRRILTREQAEQIENELAPSRDQPWRRYSRALTGAGVPARSGSRMPADPGKWLGELRDLRIDSAEGDPKHEVMDFGRKLTRGLRAGTPLFEQSDAQARVFASQVLAMPQKEFDEREWALAKLASKQELETRNRQHVADGEPIERFDPYRWFVEQMVLSARAPIALRDRAAGAG